MPQRTVQEIYAGLQDALRTALEGELATEGIDLVELSGRDVSALLNGADSALWETAEMYARIRNRIRATAAV